ncbi:MAG: YidB family protein [Rhodoferax sp.]
MSLFDSVMGAVSGHVQQQGGMASVLGGLLANNGEAGGLDGLVEKFKQAGMADQVNSWIGNGQNLPISAEQISQILGSDVVRTVAAKLGIDPDQAAQQLSALLPGLIDKLTPHGEMPAGGLGHSNDLMGMLGGFLGR